ncbi:hypothetical protein JB92DRAFT_3096048 [Gautieria morchelliformis]|nr:hypothetical protein JB92DRAFT_3096048 [Gautieria morchelliformis]
MGVVGVDLETRDGLPVVPSMSGCGNSPIHLMEMLYRQPDFIFVPTLPASCAIGLERTHHATYIRPRTCANIKKMQPLVESWWRHRKIRHFILEDEPAFFIHLNMILCVIIGRVHVAEARWGIVDQSRDFARTVFKDDYGDDAG